MYIEMHGFFFFFLGLEEIITLQSQFSQNMSNYQDVELVTTNNKMMLVIVQMRTHKKKKPHSHVFKNVVFIALL